MSLPSNAQILCLSALFIAVAALCVLGPDYIDPTVGTWQFDSSAPSVSKRAIDTATLSPFFPQYTISKAFWTSSARFGDVAFALLPLCILFALKAPPFAIFALPFMIQLHFDKLVRLHRWTGRIIWLLVAIHAGLWAVQLANDKRSGTDRIAWNYVWIYPKFISACIVSARFYDVVRC